MKNILKEELFDAAIHLGDLVADAVGLQQVLPGFPVYKVAGNNDCWTEEPEVRILQVGEKRLLLTHGHRYGVKTGAYDRLIRAAEEQGADGVLFGHTHRACLRQEPNGFFLMNPGSLRLPGRGAAPSYGVLRIEAGCIKGAIQEVKR